MLNEQQSTEIITESNLLHQQMDSNHTTINENCKYNETDTDTEHSHEGPVKVHITETISSQMETHEALALATEADEAQLYEVQLSMADIQDFVNRPA